MQMKNNISEKTEYIYADYFRLICAIGIVALHLDPFSDINKYANFFVGSVLTRLCVPFFFLLSGFFLKDKLNDWNKLSRYVLHLIKLYLVYTILYLPVNYFEYKDNGKSFLDDVLNLVKKFFFVGSYGQLWYFLALIFATFFLYVLVSKLQVNDKAMMVITTVLFVIGLFFRVYDKPIRDIVDEIRIVALYDSIFKTTRNGLFFGLPFVYWGNLIWKKKLVVERKKCGFLFVITVALLTLEALFAHNVIGASQLDMLLLLPISSILFVIIVLSKNIDYSKESVGVWCRKASVLIFGFHLLINFVLSRCAENNGVEFGSIQRFIIVVAVNVLISIIVIFSGRFRLLSWIEKVLL